MFKTSTLVTALFALSVVLFGSHTLNEFKSTVASTTDSATTQPVGAISDAYSAAFTLTDG